MRRRRFGVLSWAVILLVAAASGVWGGVASASGGCAGNCVLGVLELTGPPPVLNPSLGAGTTSSLTFTVTNDTMSNQAATAGSEGSVSKGPLLVESAALAAPEGFAIHSATLVAPRKHDPPTAAVSVNTATTPPTYTVDLDDLDLAPGASISAVLSVTASCAATSGTWALTVQPVPTAHRQGFTVDSGSALAVGVTGACSLAFAADPTNAVVSTDITNQGFAPGGPPVEVEARDASGDPLGGVGVSLSAELGAGSLTGTAASTTGASGSSLGLAAFSPISIGQTGYYTLEASAPAFVSAALEHVPDHGRGDVLHRQLLRVGEQQLGVGGGHGEQPRIRRHAERGAGRLRLPVPRQLLPHRLLPDGHRCCGSRPLAARWFARPLPAL